MIILHRRLQLVIFIQLYCDYKAGCGGVWGECRTDMTAEQTCETPISLVDVWKPSHVPSGILTSKSSPPPFFL
jgi:hypothetical protein